MLTIWRLRAVDIDGGALGRAWREWFFLTEERANEQLQLEVELRNAAEGVRGREHAMYRPCTVENVAGFCSWQYGIMYTVDSVKVSD